MQKHGKRKESGSFSRVSAAAAAAAATTAATTAAGLLVVAFLLSSKWFDEGLPGSASYEMGAISLPQLLNASQTTEQQG